jgi:hypothetical protein
METNRRLPARAEFRVPSLHVRREKKNVRRAQSALISEGVGPNPLVAVRPLAWGKPQDSSHLESSSEQPDLRQSEVAGQIFRPRCLRLTPFACLPQVVDQPRLSG